MVLVVNKDTQDKLKDIFKEEVVESQIENEINNTLKKRGIIK